ncbi:MAG: hypothetical protein Q9192_008905 [Flavoplaca navasiana]
MDVQMPVLDGYDATRLIRKDADPTVRSVLIIAMTASAIRGDREKCIDAGMNNYLAKAVRANVLKQMLESYLSQDPKTMVGLEQTANEVAKDAIAQVAQEGLLKRLAAKRTASYEAAAKSMPPPPTTEKMNGTGASKEEPSKRPPISPRKSSKSGKSFTKAKGPTSRQPAEASLVHRPKTDESVTDDQSSGWPSFMGRPKIARGVSSSNDSQRTVTEMRSHDDDEEEGMKKIGGNKP